MLIDVNDIIVKKRIRNNIGEISQLMDSMRRHGQFNPIVITSEKELIAGQRRLEAVKRLGWDKIEAKIVANPTKLDRIEIELEENLYRRNFSADEIAEAYSKIQKLKNPAFLKSLWMKIKDFFRKLFGQKK